MNIKLEKRYLSLPFGDRHAASNIDSRCNLFGDGIEFRACLQNVMRGILSHKNLHTD
jgi:hypothetical protein